MKIAIVWVKYYSIAIILHVILNTSTRIMILEPRNTNNSILLVSKKSLTYWPSVCLCFMFSMCSTILRKSNRKFHDMIRTMTWAGQEGIILCNFHLTFDFSFLPPWHNVVCVKLVHRSWVRTSDSEVRTPNTKIHWFTKQDFFGQNRLYLLNIWTLRFEKKIFLLFSKFCKYYYYLLHLHIDPN